MKSINSLVPREEAELALLRELCMCGGEGDTGYIVERSIARFPILQTASELNRETPTGRPWWAGRFRFYLSDLRRVGEVENIRRGTWRITAKGMERLKRAGHMVKKEIAMMPIEIKDSTMPTYSVTEKLMELWTNRAEGSKAEMCRQVSERIFGLQSLAALPETKSIFEQLERIIDFSELYEMLGSLSVSGFWGKHTFSESL